MKAPRKSIIGWREWLALPEIGVPGIKAKIDTGARTSALHTHDYEVFERDGSEFVRFHLHPLKQTDRVELTCEAPVLNYREVKDSGGHAEQRPFIRTLARLGKVEWEIRPEGKVRAKVSGVDGKPISLAEIQGTVGVGGKWVELEGKGEELAASIPKLEGDLTDVEYALTVKGKEWTGTIQVPPGGTDDLLTEPSETIAEGTRGPNDAIFGRKFE